MTLTFEETARIQDLFDVYDLVELLDLDVQDIVETFEDKIEGNVEILEKIGSLIDD